MIHRYKWVLQQAFARWINFRTLQVLEEQRSVVNKGWEDQNRGLMADIKVEEQVIENQKHR